MTPDRDKGGGLYLGIEIGGTKLQICVGDASARILERFRFIVDKSAGAAGIRQKLQETIPDLARRIRPLAVGVGYGGPVDWETGQICCSHHIEGWSDFPLGSWLSKLASVPVYVDNDADVAAFGEALHGAGKDFKIVFYVTLGSGVGGGLVTNGRIYHGAKPGETEIGHVRLDRSGTILESRCSGWSVDARIRAAIAKNPSCGLAKFVGDAKANEAKFLGAALAAGDSNAREILEDMAGDLAFGLSHVTQLLHPEIIVLGGGLSLIGESLRAAVDRALRKDVMKAFAPGPKIALAALGEDVVPVGALSLAKFYSSNRPHSD
jgi:glucokinase